MSKDLVIITVILGWFWGMNLGPYTRWPCTLPLSYTSNVKLGAKIHPKGTFLLGTPSLVPGQLFQFQRFCGQNFCKNTIKRTH